MRAVSYQQFGGPEVLTLVEVAKPTPKDDELLVKIHATSVNAIDIIARRGIKALYGMTKLMFGMKTPKHPILGFDVSGEVEAVGSKVSAYTKGDLIYGASQTGGANAEYICLKEKNVALKPHNMTHAEAASVPDTACTALTGIRKSVKMDQNEDQKVLLYGASGGVGAYAIQIAKLYTSDITAVCSTDKIEMAKELGAMSVIDYTKEHFWENGQKYDVIFDIVGRKKISFDLCKNSLTPTGIFITTDAETVGFRQIWNKKIKTFMAAPNHDNLEFLKTQIEAGKITSIIDKSFPLENLADAHEYYERGHLKGKVVVTI